MNEDEKIFRIGMVSFIIVLGLTFAIQVCYRAQNRERDRVRREIVQTQQEIAVAQASFAAYVRPEILRNLVSGVAPNAEVISFHKSVEIGQLTDRLDQK
ncbi:MAG: hypothetical protein IJR92_02710 [Alphaproteobacteria bacterium]|nr:hypothetical protein [Alphaproteobacteria bacterium]